MTSKAQSCATQTSCLMDPNAWSGQGVYGEGGDALSATSCLRTGWWMTDDVLILNICSPHDLYLICDWTREGRRGRGKGEGYAITCVHATPCFLMVCIDVIEIPSM